MGRSEALHRAADARLAFAVATALLALGATPAQADPTFVVAQSGAGPGEIVQFSITDTETRAGYSLELAGKEVAVGSGAAASGAAGQFAMPDLGAAARTVVVEAEIREPEDTTTRTRSLRYLPPAPQNPALS